MTVFATKSNPTTKENIANVYGAKTIPALIPLNLHLEMEVSVPSQALAEFHGHIDVGARNVEVQGHISRPAHGEGRQTPDRQMFFVNSRPCGLPQIAKAFNEVYKSYNVTQSPFVFANLKMNTNAYDVNVSPDKRTIMLHDQTRLIETLKDALGKLFESQDQTVPLSQRPSAKLPILKPLSVTREASAGSGSSRDSPEIARFKTPQPSTQSTIASSTVESSSGSVGNGPQTDLTSRFVGRHVEPRKEPAETPPAHDGNPSREKQRLARKFREEGADENPKSNPQVDEQIHLGDGPDSPFHAPSRIVQDFNDRLASQRARHATLKETTGKSAEIEAQTLDEDEIPSVNVSPTKASPGVVQSALNQARPRTTPSDIATITIDRSTSTAVIGSQPPAKRRRVSPTENYTGHRSTSQSSQFGQRLSAFAAPGTQVLSPAGRTSKSKSPISTGSHGNDIDDDASDESASADEEIVDNATPASRAQQISHASVADDDRSIANSDADHDDPSDDEYIDEKERRLRDEARAQQLVMEAEHAAAIPTQVSIKRTANVLRRSGEEIVNLVKFVTISTAELQYQAACLRHFDAAHETGSHSQGVHPSEDLQTTTTQDAEERLSLTISKSDFAKMRIIGQFNLGFILAVRSAAPTPNAPHASTHSDDLFIIDQHASDEIYNFHRLAATTQLTPQPLVRPQPLELTAIEEEIVITHAAHSLALNGFNIAIDESGNAPTGSRCNLLTLPTSNNVTFDTRDLQELLVLLADHSDPGSGQERQRDVVRPSKVRKMLAMRACRSSIMVGKALTRTGMERVVRHMGEMERPWNCPHGRPTMRHLTGLGEWRGWDGCARDAWDHQEVDGDEREREGKGWRGGDWAGWVAGVRGRQSRNVVEENDGEVEGQDGIGECEAQDDADDGAGDVFFAGEYEDGDVLDEDDESGIEDGVDQREEEKNE